ncbi:hypothetical protein F5882DRAFT_414300 [Hyaloscypha sp. PMI_1271]|nr:hypothetical protein F5882DRAFT_414300 [Hyaloscypha sp. PMI_1271]
MTNEADIKAAILDCASENSSLLVKLSSTSTAPSLLAGHEKHLTALKANLSEHTVILQKLKDGVDSKFKRHRKLRDSTTRRFIYRATNMLAKFDAKAMKEEREYFDLLNEQSKAEKRRLLLQRDYNEAVEQQELLEREVQEHAKTHARIDELYERLFAGPTPGFPREDEREHRFYAARGKNETIKEAIRSRRQVRRILTVSQGHVKQAKIALRNADQKAVDSVFFLDDAFARLRRGNELITDAINSTGRIEGYLAPFLEMVAVKVEVDSYLKASKSVVDTAFTRENIVAAVASALASLSKAEEALERLATLTKQKEEKSLENIKGTARQVEDSRQELEQFRKSIFEKVAGFGEAAPAYTECCDRTEGFCEVSEEAEEEDNYAEEMDAPIEELVAPVPDPEVNSTRAALPDHENAEVTSQLSVEIPLRRKDD